MPEDIFITYPAKVAFKTYQTRWQLGDIYISGNAKPTEDNPEGHWLLPRYDRERV